ncbi:MmyB family transcriptional regulator [Streptomyces griseus]|uniref:MmyB family transcriptional regulator n=1 Tax=Streptomyces griseus TaxID=1911 RepID=UPI0036F5E6BF
MVLAVPGAVRAQLEQGRAKNPSPQMLAAFAQTLRLNAVDHELLYRLAGNLIWGHFAAPPAPGASGIERGAAHADAFERMMVSDLRRAADRYPDDRAVTELINGLRESDRRFAELWTRYETLPIGRSNKTVVHPDLGEIVLDYDIMTIERAGLAVALNSTPRRRKAERSGAEATAGRAAGSPHMTPALSGRRQRCSYRHPYC